MIDLPAIHSTFLMAAQVAMFAAMVGACCWCAWRQMNIKPAKFAELWGGRSSPAPPLPHCH